MVEEKKNENEIRVEEREIGVGGEEQDRGWRKRLK